MSDPRMDAELTVGDSTYIIRFTHSALVHAEKLTRRNVAELSVQLATGQFGMTEVQALVCAGLEGARRKLRLGGKPWTPEPVSDLLDDVAEFSDVADPVVEAWDAAMRRWFPEESEPADPQPAAGTSSDSSEPPSEQGSAPTSSGD